MLGGRARRLSEGLHDVLACRVAAEDRRAGVHSGAGPGHRGTSARAAEDIAGSERLFLSGQRAAEGHACPLVATAFASTRARDRGWQVRAARDAGARVHVHVLAAPTMSAR